jgi:hypothetical protein
MFVPVYHTDFTAFTRHVNDFDPISPISRPRGYGGIAVVYKKTLSPSITQLPDGDHRIPTIIVRVFSYFHIISRKVSRTHLYSSCPVVVPLAGKYTLTRQMDLSLVIISIA